MLWTLGWDFDKTSTHQPNINELDKEVEDIVSKLKVFKEDEFASLLEKCHNVIRDDEAHDPTKAFDETAKILFVKVYVERQLKKSKKRDNIFTVEKLDEQFVPDPLNHLFTATKAFYKNDALFSEDEKINLTPDTGKKIVKLLERYNLSDTSEDIKGIAFEKFLGRTFRGEIGQYFNPRPIVEFIIRMIEPKEGETICDPASGSGGFLIRFFEIAREKILKSLDDEYKSFETVIESDASLDESAKAAAKLKKYAEIQKQTDPSLKNSRLWNLANRCIFGTDKNDRMARTSKMNMIMHGDGHGGVHHWNGFLNVNGIFEDRFDVVLTNPPFGSKLSFDSKVVADDVAITDEHRTAYENVYQQPYKDARAKLEKNIDKPIAGMFELPSMTKGSSSIKTEVLFVERCLNLLKPGGRLGIVLPEGIFNNPSMEFVRDFVEGRARIEAVVSVPVDAFIASGATVKTSILFLRKFTETESANWKKILAKATLDETANRAMEVKALKATIKQPAPTAKMFPVPKGAAQAVAAAVAAQLSQAREAHKQNVAAARKGINAIESKILAASRVAARGLANYPIFFYDAAKVGITSTGEGDDNELYPNPSVATGTLTALDEFQQFKALHADFFSKNWACAKGLPDEQSESSK